MGLALGEDVVRGVSDAVIQVKAELGCLIRAYLITVHEVPAMRQLKGL